MENRNGSSPTVINCALTANTATGSSGGMYNGQSSGPTVEDFSFTASCQRHEIDPFAFLRYVLTRISACPINEIDQFLPDNWRTRAAVGTDGEKVRVQ